MPHTRLLRSSRPLLAAIAFLLAVVGCNPQDMLNRLAPPSADARSREYLQLLVRGQVDSAYDRLAPAQQSEQARTALHQLAGVLAGRSLDSMQRIGMQINTVYDVQHVNLSYQFHDAQGWFAANVATVGPKGQVPGDGQVEGVSMNPLPASLQQLNAFTLSGKGPRHYLWLLATVIAFVISLGTAIRVALTRGMPRRWLWTIVALIGLVRFSLDWSNGAWTIVPINFLLLSAGFMKGGPVAPWILSFALPVGAVWAELKRRAWLRQSAIVVTPPVDATPRDAAPTSG